MAVTEQKMNSGHCFPAPLAPFVLVPSLFPSPPPSRFA